MRSSRALSILAGTTAIALATLVVAAPASAATLPPGQKITIIDALDETGPQEGPFYNVNPADAAATPVGTGSGAYTLGVDVNDDGIGFAIGFAQVGDVFGPTLWDVDANTGTATNPRIMAYPSGDRPSECEGIDLNPSSGQLLVSCTFETPNDVFSTINSVNTATGELAALVSLGGDERQTFTALATNPVTGVLWGFGPLEGDASFIIDLTQQTSDFQAFLEHNVFGADFDRNGQLFLISQVDGDEFNWRSLAVTDPSVGTYTFNERLVDQSTDVVLFFTNSITVWGKLAATGSTPAETAPIAIGSALLLLAGAAFIATARLSRRRAA